MDGGGTEVMKGRPWGLGSPAASPTLSGDDRAGSAPGPASLVLVSVSKLPAWVPCGPRGKLRAAGAEPKKGSGLSPVTL